MSERRSNFSFLAEQAPLLPALRATCEGIFPDYPAIYVFKLRMLAETFRGELMSQYLDDGPTAELLTWPAAQRRRSPQKMIQKGAEPASA